MAAARRLGRSAPAVTRELIALESKAGAALVERTTRRCQPTSNGRELAERARAILTAYDDAFGAVRNEEAAPEGTLRITTPVTFGIQYVANLVNDFIDQHAAISVELQMLDRVVDLIEEEYDLAVRIGPVTGGSLMTRRVGAIAQLMVASPAYMARRGEPRSISDLVDHEIILQAGDMRSPAGPSAGWVNATSAMKTRLTVNQPEAAIAAAREGRGLANVLASQVVSELASGALCRVLVEHEPAPLPVTVVWPPSRRNWRRVRLMVDHLASNLSRLDVLHHF